MHHSLVHKLLLCVVNTPNWGEVFFFWKGLVYTLMYKADDGRIPLLVEVG